MYSLYRAWFGHGSTEEQDFPRLHQDTYSPPDTLIRVGNEGEHQFVAHKGVLAAHSGYLKALLANAAPTPSTSRMDTVDAFSLPSVSVSSIGGEAFAPLLNYMYTGHLEVTLDNVYSVLLATHLLHMPGALEQCRAALMRLRVQPPVPPATSLSSAGGSRNILRPIPNRLTMIAPPPPPLCWGQPLPLYLTSSPITSSTTTSLSQLEQTSPKINSTEVVSKSTEITSSSQVDQSKIKRDPEGWYNNALASPARSRSSSSISPAPSSSPSIRSNESSVLLQNQQRGYRKYHYKNDRGESSMGGREKRGKLHKHSDEKIVEASENGTVVYDIACCDGPVQFHRVLNDNYSSNWKKKENNENEDTDEVEVIPSQEVRNITEDNGSVNVKIYTCTFCRHTFKSRHCYRKHMKRHLLSTAVSTITDTVTTSTPTVSTTSTSTTNDTKETGNDQRNKKEVRLLGLNIHYYPCKICGCKFPSYYFVHKHRRLCHPNYDDGITTEPVNERDTTGEETIDPRSSPKD